MVDEFIETRKIPIEEIIAGHVKQVLVRGGWTAPMFPDTKLRPIMI